MARVLEIERVARVVSWKTLIIENEEPWHHSKRDHDRIVRGTSLHTANCLKRVMVHALGPKFRFRVRKLEVCGSSIGSQALFALRKLPAVGSAKSCLWNRWLERRRVRRSVSRSAQYVGKRDLDQADQIGSIGAGRVQRGGCNPRNETRLTDPEKRVCPPHRIRR